MILDHFLAYFIIIFLATIIPGPNMLLALNHGANYGITKTIYSGLGNMMGNLLMGLISILGLGIILLKSAILFNIIKWIGVFYLIYLGVKIFFEPLEVSKNNSFTEKVASNKKKSRLIFDGFFIAVSNPKGIFFFTSLFPQFISQNNSPANELLIIFLTMGFVTFSCYILYGIFGQKLNALFQLTSFRKFFNRLTGSLLIGIGLSIAFSKSIL